MGTIRETLHYFAYYLMNKYPQFENLWIHVSSANVPDEGDFKIYQFIKEREKMKAKNQTLNYLIISNDSDLLLLGNYEMYQVVLIKFPFFNF